MDGVFGNRCPFKDVIVDPVKGRFHVLDGNLRIFHSLTRCHLCEFIISLLLPRALERRHCRTHDPNPSSHNLPLFQTLGYSRFLRANALKGSIGFLDFRGETFLGGYKAVELREASTDLRL
jgi:hypothetical protein